MKKLFTPVFLAVVMISVQSCSKEKRMERMMYKSDGLWNITTMTYTFVSTDDNNITVTVSATAENPGTFTFDKDGKGSYNFTLDGINHAQSFGWGTSNESLSITKISQNIDFFTGGDIEQLVITLGGEKAGKNRITLSGSETIQETSGTNITQSVLTMDMTLDKK